MHFGHASRWPKDLRQRAPRRRFRSVPSRPEHLGILSRIIYYLVQNIAYTLCTKKRTD
jgi:hypothetical protein